MYVYSYAYVEARGQRVGFDSLFLPHGAQGWNSNHQAWWQVLFRAEPSLWSTDTRFCVQLLLAQALWKGLSCFHGVCGSERVGTPQPRTPSLSSGELRLLQTRGTWESLTVDPSTQAWGLNHVGRGREQRSESDLQEALCLVSPPP